MRIRIDYRRAVCIFYGCHDTKNANLAADSLYADFGCPDNCSLYHCIPLVPHKYVAALGNVFSLFRNLIFRKLSSDDDQGKNRKQAHGRSLAKIKGKGGKLK